MAWHKHNDVPVAGAAFYLARSAVQWGAQKALCDATECVISVSMLWLVDVDVAVTGARRRVDIDTSIILEPEYQITSTMVRKRANVACDLGSGSFIGEIQPGLELDPLTLLWIVNEVAEIDEIVREFICHNDRSI
jgi:hypothetical protein